MLCALPSTSRRYRRRLHTNNSVFTAALEETSQLQCNESVMRLPGYRRDLTDHALRYLLMK